MRSFKSAILAICACLIAATSAFAADTRSTGDVEVNVWAKPNHLGSAPKGAAFFQSEAGVGVRYYIKVSTSGYETFVDMNKFIASTHMGSATTLRAGVQKQFFSVGHVGMIGGIAIEAVQYENKWQGKTHTVGGITPLIGARFDRVTVTFAYTAPATVDGTKYPGMVTTCASFKF